MVFRRESKSDAFQRQISALRQQLGGAGETETEAGDERAHEPYDGEHPATQAPPQSSPAPANRDAGGFSFGGFGTAATFDQTTASPTAEPQGSTPMTAAPVADEHTSVIAGNAVWKGDFESGGALHVRGRAEGSLRAKDDIFVAEEADVDATITATNVIVAGLVKGTIRCGGRFEVLPGGRVSGDIQAPTLVVHEGANVVGQIRMGTGSSDQAASEAESAAPRRVAHGGA